MKRYQLLTAATSVVLLTPTFAAAISLPTIVQCTGINCTCEDLIKTAQNILNLAIYLAVFFSAILFAVAGWYLMTGHNNAIPGDVKTGKSILWNVIIGLVIMLAAWLIVQSIFAGLVKGIGISANLCKLPTP
jgi:hypothetical protein